jgi:hypothetical protein
MPAGSGGLHQHGLDPQKSYAFLVAVAFFEAFFVAFLAAFFGAAFLAAFFLATAHPPLRKN